MIQVDVFWSFAFGASFATAAAKALQKEPNFYANQYFAYCAFYLGCIFAPSGIYLLWAFPGWESMFLLGAKDTVHAILPTVFSATNVLFGLVGFWAAYALMRRGQVMEAHTLWIAAYSCFAAILGFGYTRFLYAGTHADWAKHHRFALTDWFTSDVFVALLCMSPIVLPFYMVPVALWMRDNYDRWELRVVMRQVVVRAAIAWLVFAVGFLIVCAAAGEHFRESIAMGPLNFAAPLLAFTVAQVVVFAILLIPIEAARIMHRPSRAGVTSPGRATSPARRAPVAAARSRSPARGRLA